MAYRWKNELKDSDVTDHSVFLNRRQLLAGTAGLGLAATLGSPRTAQAEGGPALQILREPLQRLADRQPAWPFPDQADQVGRLSSRVFHMRIFSLKSADRHSRIRPGIASA